MPSDPDTDESATMDSNASTIVGWQYNAAKGELTLETNNYRKWEADVEATKFPVVPMSRQTISMAFDLFIWWDGILVTVVGLIMYAMAFPVIFFILWMILRTGCYLFLIPLHVKPSVVGKGSSISGQHAMSVPEFMQKASTADEKLRIMGRGKRSGRKYQPEARPSTAFSNQQDDVISWTYDNPKPEESSDTTGPTHVIAVEDLNNCAAIGTIVYGTPLAGPRIHQHTTFYLFVCKDVHDMVRKGDTVVEWKYTSPTKCDRMKDFLMNWLTASKRTVTFKWIIHIPEAQVEKRESSTTKECDHLSDGPKEEDVAPSDSEIEPVHTSFDYDHDVRTIPWLICAACENPRTDSDSCSTCMSLCVVCEGPRTDSDSCSTCSTCSTCMHVLKRSVVERYDEYAMSDEEGAESDEEDTFLAGLSPGRY